MRLSTPWSSNVCGSWVERAETTRVRRPGFELMVANWCFAIVRSLLAMVWMDPAAWRAMPGKTAGLVAMAVPPVPVDLGADAALVTVHRVAQVRSLSVGAGPLPMAVSAVLAVTGPPKPVPMVKHPPRRVPVMEAAVPASVPSERTAMMARMEVRAMMAHLPALR